MTAASWESCSQNRVHELVSSRQEVLPPCQGFVVFVYALATDCISDAGCLDQVALITGVEKHLCGECIAALRRQRPIENRFRYLASRARKMYGPEPAPGFR